MTDMATDNLNGSTNDAEKWMGGVIVISEQAIPNIRPEKYLSHICCYVTGMKMDNQVVHGYSNIVSNLEIIFGNTVQQNIPIELTIELPTLVDSNKYLEGAFNDTMAAVSILGGKKIDILFGMCMLKFALISQSQINYYPGIQGAIAHITLVGYEYYNMTSAVTSIDSWKYYRSDIDYHVPNIDAKAKNMLFAGETILFSRFSLAAMSITHRENIKIIGKDEEFTVYPRYPTMISISLNVPLHPELQNQTNNANDTPPISVEPPSWGSNASGNTENSPGPMHNIEYTYETLNKAVSNKNIMFLTTDAYGDIEFMPTSITTSRTQFMQGEIGLMGIVMQYMPGPTIPDTGIDERI